MATVLPEARPRGKNRPARKWIKERRKTRSMSRKFTRKASLKYQFMLCMLAILYVLLPNHLGDETWSNPLNNDLGGRGLSSSTNSTPSEQFPKGVFTMEQTRKGGFIINILVMLYMFIGLAIICDEYFEPSLEGICEALNLKEDVAGATFMAAGGSAPELFSSVIGVFVAENDIGFGTIVGSATFNVLFVISACSFITYNLTLSWWPLTRDSVFYCLSIVLLVACIVDNQVHAWEAAALLVMYGIYITIMYYNESLERYVTKKVQQAEEPRTGIALYLQDFVENKFFTLFIYAVVIANLVVVIIEATSDSDSMDDATTTTLNNIFSVIFILEMVLKCIAYTFFGYWKNPVNAFDGTLAVLILFEWFLQLAQSVEDNSVSFSGAFRVLRFLRMARALRLFKLYMATYVEKADAATQTEEGDWGLLEHADQLSKVPVPRRRTSLPATIQPTSRTSASVAPLPIAGSLPVKSDAFVSPPEPTEPTLQDQSDAQSENAKDESRDDGKEKQGEQDKDGEEEEEEEDDDDDGPSNPFEIPDGSLFDKFMWAFSFPLAVCMFLTIPDCRRQVFKKFYFVTFMFCILWIAVLAYVMVWMATIFGEATRIPESILGLTLIAAGTSIPDLLSSMAVARRGFGDMAVSSSIGSNIFDILVGLPVPWFLKTAIVDPGSAVPIHSCGLTIIVLTLFLMVAAVVSIIHWCNWVMSRRLGVAMMALYVLFVIESVLIEQSCS